MRPDGRLPHPSPRPTSPSKRGHEIPTSWPDFGWFLARFSVVPKIPSNSAPYTPSAPLRPDITNVGLVGEIPLAEPPSWATPAMNPYNSYRRNAQGAKAFCAPDLQVYDLDVDYLKCPDLAMSVWVANLGCLGVGPGVPVSFYEQNKGYLGTAFTKGPLAAGAAEQVSLSVPNVTESVTIHAVVDDDGMGMGGLNECKESNNETEPLLVCVVPK